MTESDHSLAIIDRYADNMYSVGLGLNRLRGHCASTPYFGQMNSLLQGLGQCLAAFSENETMTTLPLLLSIRNTLSLAASTLETTPSQRDIQSILSQLARYPPSLDKILNLNTQSLTDIKRLENSVLSAKKESTAGLDQLKKQAKGRKTEGHRTAILGGILGPLTFGVSLKMGIDAGNAMLQEADPRCNIIIISKPRRQLFATRFPIYSRRALG